MKEYYGLHIPLNYFDEVFKEKDVTRIIEKYNGKMAEISANPLYYATTLLFSTAKQRNMAYSELYNIGIIPVVAFTPITINETTAYKIV